jgi:hypothetical protein
MKNKLKIFLAILYIIAIMIHRDKECLMIDDESLENLSKHLRDASQNSFTGKIQINFCDGGISSITKERTIKETLIINQKPLMVI